MNIKTGKIISITEANQNFSKAIHIADCNGEAIIFKRNKPKYVLINIDENPQIEMTDDEKIMFVARRVLAEHKEAFKELAK